MDQSLQQQQQQQHQQQNHIGITPEQRGRVIAVLRQALENCNNQMVSQAPELERNIFNRSSNYEDYQNFVKMLCAKLHENNNNNAANQTGIIRERVPRVPQQFRPSPQQPNYPASAQFGGPQSHPAAPASALQRPTTPRPQRNCHLQHPPQPQQQQQQQTRIIHHQRNMPSAPTNIYHQPPNSMTSAQYTPSQLPPQPSSVPQPNRQIPQPTTSNSQNVPEFPPDASDAEKAVVYQECTSMIPTIRSFLTKITRRQITAEINECVITRSKALVDHFERRSTIHMIPLLRVRSFLEKSLMPIMAAQRIGLERAHDPLTPLQNTYIALLQQQQQQQQQTEIEQTKPNPPPPPPKPIESSKSTSSSNNNSKSWDESEFTKALARFRKRPLEYKQAIAASVRQQFQMAGIELDPPTQHFERLNKRLKLSAKKEDNPGVASAPPQPQEYKQLCKPRASLGEMQDLLQKHIDAAESEFGDKVHLSVKSHPIHPLEKCVLNCYLAPSLFMNHIPLFEIHLKPVETTNTSYAYHAYCEFPRYESESFNPVLEKLLSLKEPIELEGLVRHIVS